MKAKFFLIAILLNFKLLAQIDPFLQRTLDSILDEGLILYSYEKVAWISTDSVLNNQNLVEKLGTYLVYKIDDTLFATYTDTSRSKRIAFFKFLTSNLQQPFFVSFKTSNLTKKEKKLLKIRQKILRQLKDTNFKFTFYQNFSPNFELLEYADGYKFYILTGTTQQYTIPLGNDYVFWVDSAGNIIKWRKFHSTLIVVYFEPIDEISAIYHTHLKTTPLITATDICNFKIYGEFYSINNFIVYSPYLRCQFLFNIESNEISVVVKNKFLFKKRLKKLKAKPQLI